MDANERAEIVAHLRETLGEMERELRGVTPAQANYRAAEGRWSILDNIEHLCKTESGMFVLMTALAVNTPALVSGREAQFERSLLDRGRSNAAPERVHPRGAYPTLEDALDDFRKRRQRTIEYVEETDDDLRQRSTKHPIAGEISCRECLALIMHHPRRHLAQIREIKSEPGYPA